MSNKDRRVLEPEEDRSFYLKPNKKTERSVRNQLREISRGKIDLDELEDWEFENE